MNMKKSKTILIAGAGELGSRYLQSMADCDTRLEIHLHSDRQNSLDMCKQRWQDVEGDSLSHNIHLHPYIDTLPIEFDLVIVASTANTRPQLIESITKKAKVKYWIIEKIVAQSESGLDDISRNISQSKKAWVNFYMSSQPLYKEIKKHLTNEQGMRLEVTGGSWGLACNALHFLHLLSWFSGESLISLDASELDAVWHESKRAGNWEIFGKLTGKFSSTAEAYLESSDGSIDYTLKLKDGPYVWNIDEANGIATRSDGLEVREQVYYQSGRPLVNEIIESGNCDLPLMNETLELHNIFIRTMLEHWQEHKDSSASFVPIT